MCKTQVVDEIYGKHLRGARRISGDHPGCGIWSKWLRWLGRCCWGLKREWASRRLEGGKTKSLCQDGTEKMKDHERLCTKNTMRTIVTHRASGYGPVATEMGRFKRRRMRMNPVNDPSGSYKISTRKGNAQKREQRIMDKMKQCINARVKVCVWRSTRTNCKSANGNDALNCATRSTKERRMLLGVGYTVPGSESSSRRAESSVFSSISGSLGFSGRGFGQTKRKNCLHWGWQVRLQSEKKNQRWCMKTKQRNK